MKHLALLFASALLLAGKAQSAPVSITNPSFEADNSVAPNTFPAITPQGWSVYDPEGIINGSNRAVGVLYPAVGSTFFPAGAPDGHNVALVWLDDGNGVGNEYPLGLTQTLGAVLTADTRYTLNVEVGNIDSGIGDPPYDQFGFFNIKGFPGYAVQLLAGGVVIAEDNNSLGASLAEGTFGTSTLQAVIGADHPQLGQNLAIRLINLNGPGTAQEPGIEVDFDNVRLDAQALPTPATAWLFGIGWVGLCWINAHRKNGLALAHRPTR